MDLVDNPEDPVDLVDNPEDPVDQEDREDNLVVLVVLVDLADFQGVRAEEVDLGALVVDQQVLLEDQEAEVDQVL